MAFTKPESYLRIEEAAGERQDAPDEAGQQHLCQKAGHPGKKAFKLERLANGDYDLQLGEETEASSGKQMMQAGGNKRDVRNYTTEQKDTYLKRMSTA